MNQECPTEASTLKHILRSYLPQAFHLCDESETLVIKKVRVIERQAIEGLIDS